MDLIQEKSHNHKIKDRFTEILINPVLYFYHFLHDLSFSTL